MNPLSGDSGDHPPDHSSIDDLIAEVFPVEDHPHDDESPPPIPMGDVRAMLAQVAEENRHAETWTITSRETTNPIGMVLLGQRPVSVIIERPGFESLAGTLQVGHVSRPARDQLVDRPAFPIAAAAPNEVVLSAESEDGFDEESSREAPLCLFVPDWPLRCSLRGVDVVPVLGKEEQTPDAVVLTSRRIKDGFELDYLPNERGTLERNSAAIRMTVVRKGGSHV